MDLNVALVGVQAIGDETVRPGQPRFMARAEPLGNTLRVSTNSQKTDSKQVFDEEVDEV